MLVEAEVQPDAETPERPIKRRRPGQRNDGRSQKSAPPAESAERIEKDEFEDVEIPVAAIQTIERDTDDDGDDDEEDMAFEDVNLSFFNLEPSPVKNAPEVLELNLSAHIADTSPKTANRRKPISKTEKDHRVEIHKTHLLCLMAHVSRRNRWCNDPVVQECLRPLLTEKMETYLNPDASLPQFGRTQSLKNGLQDVLTMFKIKFRVTERGMRRALWAENEEHLQRVNIPYYVV